MSWLDIRHFHSVTCHQIMKTILLTLLCLLGGPYLSYRNTSNLMTSMRAKSWPTTEGIVSSVNVEQSSGRRGQLSFRPVIKYGYTVTGLPYGGQRIDFGDESTSSVDEAMATVAGYHEGQSVTVHYDSKNPANSVLETGNTGSSWFGLLLGLVMTAMGVYSVRGLWRKLHDNEYAPSATGF